MGTIQCVVGGQFGSEGKGAIAAHLMRKGESKITAVRVAGPNAGHSAVDADGRKWALRQVPVAAVVNEEATLVIAAGSEIDPDVLEGEIVMLEDGGFKVRERLYIDSQATVIESHHLAREATGGLVDRIGSTGKGIGAARAARIMREAPTWGDVECEMDRQVAILPCDTANLLAAHLQADRCVVIEGTQGYGLGLHAGYYPQCTSSDCRAVDFLSMCGISPWAPYVDKTEVIVVLRTYPIRVAGNSGPLKSELSWSDLTTRSGGHIQEERTTVTQKVRRVGAWDADLAARAVAENGGAMVCVALTFFDYWYPELYGMLSAEVLKSHHWDQIRQVEQDVQAKVCYLGTGPGSLIEL